METRLVSRSSQSGGQENPAPKSRVSLHPDFPHLSDGTRMLFHDEHDKPQSQIRRFLRPILDEEGKASGE